MGRLRRRQARQEPIRTVDAVVVPRDQPDPPRTEEDPRPTGAELGVAAEDCGRPPTAPEAPGGAENPVGRPRAGSMRTEAQTAPDTDDPSLPDLRYAAWIDEIARVDDVVDRPRQETPHEPTPHGRAESPITPVVEPLPDEERGAAEVELSPLPITGDPAVLGHLATRRVSSIYDYPSGPYEDDDVDEVVPASVDTTICRIAVWRGYRKSTFYAQAFDTRGDEVALAESPSFRWRGNGTPEKTEAAARAHSALLQLLRDTGWEPTRNGASWFDLTLTRR
jgi:hypothetical protein